MHQLSEGHIRLDVCKILCVCVEGTHRSLSFDYQTNDFNSAGPEKLASDDQLHSSATGFVNQYYPTLPCFLWEEFFAAPSRIFIYEETKPAELKISKRYSNDAKDTSQIFK